MLPHVVVSKRRCLDPFKATAVAEFCQALFVGDC